MSDLPNDIEAKCDTTTLEVLCVIADPSDQPRFDGEAAWSAVLQASESFQGRITCQRLSRPTETMLHSQLSSHAFNVLYFAGHAECRVALRYTSVGLESSSGQIRRLDGAYFASLLASCPTLKTVVLQACNPASFCFELIAGALIEKGVEIVVMMPPLKASATSSAMERLYSKLLSNSPTHELEQVLQSAHPDAQALKATTQQVPFSPVVTLPKAHAARVNAQPIVSSPVLSPDAGAAQSELRRKRETERFDVFLCHNSNDKRAVIAIAQRLKAAGILPWLDIWELPPGKPWQPELERQLPTIRSAAVFVGAAGVGPWQEAELDGFLDEFANRKLPVIPVLLPDVVHVPALPFFLRRMVWVDFRVSDPDPFERLIWGITGKRPED